MAMFEQTFVDGVGKTNKGWTVVVSFGIQFLIVVVLILIPLIYTDVLPQAQLTSMLTAPPPPPPPPPPKPKATVARVGGNVQASKLINQPKPVYPPLAKAARVQGTVKFQATIGKDGKIENLQLLGGPPLLVQAAMQAVQQWTYQPTLLNGDPVDVITTIDVNFTLN